MTNQRCPLFTHFLLSLLATSAIASGRLAASQAEVSLAGIVQRSALIAHVRVAGEVEFGEGRAQFVEILDEVRGPAAGQLAITMNLLPHGSQEDRPPKWKTGEQYILFAERDDNGVYHPLSATCRAEDTEKLRALLPPHSPATVVSAVAHLREECRRGAVRLTVQLNERDLRNYQPHSPLRVEISIDNLGVDEIHFENRIDYEFRHGQFIDRNMLRRLREETRLRSVMLCVQPLGLRRQSELMEEMKQLSAVLAVLPGQRASGTYDLAEEYDIQSGGRFLVWAELGGHRSAPLQLELPEPTEAIEMMAKLAEMKGDDGGPFHLVKRTPAIANSMPDVGATVAGDAIAAALGFWFRDSRQGAEVVILRTTNLPGDFSPHIAGIQLAPSEVQWREDGKPTALKTSRGEATFRWRVIRIHSVEVQAEEATVEITENDRHNLGGCGATIPLRRKNGQWQVAGEIQLWQS